MGHEKKSTTSFIDALKVGPDFALSERDPRDTPGFSGKKKDGEKLLAETDDAIDSLQERLYAEGRTGGQKRVLLVIQGLDTAGKGGIMRHVVGMVDPQGVEITAFKKPTAKELEHSFLWRIRKALPEAGIIGVFDRSHYEDVLIVAVHDIVPESQWKRRYSTINAFEKKLADEGTTIIKVMMHISKDEQKERLTERLDRADKHWKYNPGDISERRHWSAYQQAYQAVLDETSTPEAPWFVVPADRKWYARLAVQQLLLEHLEALKLTWPVADFNVEVERARLAKS